MVAYEDHSYSMPGDVMPMETSRRASHEYFRKEGRDSESGKLLGGIYSKIRSLNKTIGKDSTSNEVGHMIRRLNKTIYDSKLDDAEKKEEYASVLNSLERIEDIFKSSKDNLAGIIKYLSSPSPSVRDLGILLYNVANTDLNNCSTISDYFEKIAPEFEDFLVNPDNKHDDVYRSLSEPLTDEDSLEDELLGEFEGERLEDKTGNGINNPASKKLPFVSGTFSMLEGAINEYKPITDFCFAYSTNSEVMSYLDIFFSDAYNTIEGKHAEKDIKITKTDIDWVIEKSGEEDRDLVAAKLDEFNGNLKAAVKYFKARK